MERNIEILLLATRWLLVPLYLGLLASVLGIYAMVGRELLHLVTSLTTISEAELVLVILSILDLVLVANLVVMVAISSYESFVSRIDVDREKPEWLGKMDASNVKMKVSLSIVMVSAINLLRAFMMDTPAERLPLLAGVHIVFLLSTLAVAVVERVHGKDK
ncbi:conserved membrane protein of unknown function [Rhodovastum atsumiense]|nr:YqhA family protein [Rhodovastum atsumiense]CAH2599257.1 conserved membrane protein of unknown function [Rhodovastum atsumiense]